MFPIGQCKLSIVRRVPIGQHRDTRGLYRAVWECVFTDLESTLNCCQAWAEAYHMQVGVLVQDMVVGTGASILTTLALGFWEEKTG